MKWNSMVRSIGKLAAGMALGAMLAGFVPAEYARAETSFQVGDVVGKVLSTDIEAQVNGSTIASMNIDGLTAVVAEDLRNYGFDVAWVPQRKEVAIAPVHGKTIRSKEAAPGNKQPVGQEIGDVLYTNIRATYEGKSIRSFNIGGKTAIVLNDLASFGKLDWNEGARKLSFVPEPAGTERKPMDGLLAVNELDIIKVSGMAISAEGVTYEGVNIGIVEDGMPYLSVEWIARQLGYETVTDEDGAVRLTDGDYELTMRPGEKEVGRSWFGLSLQPLEQFRAPILKDGVLYAYQVDLKNYMGYETVWSPDTNLLDITYKTYLVEDYGVPESLDNYDYTVRMVGNFSLYDYPVILMRNRINGEKQSYAVSSGSSIFDGELKELYGYSSISKTTADIGTNELLIEIEMGNRPLYAKRFTVELTYHNVKPMVNIAYDMNNIVHVKEVHPQQAYAEPTADTFTVSGTVTNNEGSTLNVKVTREDNPEEAVGTLSVPIKDLAFKADILLPGEPGVYRITVSSILTFPRGTTDVPVAKWYVRKVVQ